MALQRLAQLMGETYIASAEENAYREPKAQVMQTQKGEALAAAARKKDPPDDFLLKDGSKGKDDPSWNIARGKPTDLKMKSATSNSDESAGDVVELWTSKENEAPAAGNMKPKKTKASEQLAQRGIGSGSGSNALNVLGEISPPGMSFCPIMAVKDFPYRFMYEHAGSSQMVSERFFAAQQFWNRTWTLYFIEPPPEIAANALLLVPANEVAKLLREINENLDLAVGLPRREGFCITFFDDGMPRPRMLGSTTSRDEVCALENTITTLPALKEPIGPSASATKHGNDRSWAAFKAKIEHAILVTKKNKGAARLKRQKERVIAKEHWIRQLRHTQRYFGLRKRQSDIDVECHHQVMTAENAHFDLSSADRFDDLPVPDVKQAVRHPFDSDVVLIAIDVEAFEHAHSEITEIGISILDTRDLVGVAPGENGKDWMSLIRPLHIRIKENAHKINKDHVNGCPDRFEFGESMFVGLDEIQRILSATFNGPFSPCYRPQKPGRQTDEISSGVSITTSSANTHRTESALLAMPPSHQPANAAKAATSPNGLASDDNTMHTLGPSDASKKLNSGAEAAITFPLDAPSDTNSTKAPVLGDAAEMPNQSTTKSSSATEGNEEIPSPESVKPGELYEKRNIVVLGHDVKADINYLRSIGFDVTSLSSVIEILDTSELYRAMTQESQPCSLGRLIYDLGLVGWNLHNAGNDAAYTLQSLIGIALRSCAPLEERRNASPEEKIEQAKKAAEDRARGELWEWDKAGKQSSSTSKDDGNSTEEDDGGVKLSW